MSIVIRAGLLGLAAAITLAGCGKKPEQAATSEQAAPAAPAAEEAVVNVYNWSDYIDPATLEQLSSSPPRRASR